MKSYKIGSWKNKNKIYIYSDSKGLSKKYNKRMNNEEISGFFYRVNNENLICYTTKKHGYLIYKDNKINLLDKNLHVSIEVKWPFVIAVIKYNLLKISFKEFSPVLLLQSKFDPTFDWLDVSSDLFSAYLIEEIDYMSLPYPNVQTT